MPEPWVRTGELRCPDEVAPRRVSEMQAKGHCLESDWDDHSAGHRREPKRIVQLDDFGWYKAAGKLP